MAEEVNLNEEEIVSEVEIMTEEDRVKKSHALHAENKKVIYKKNTGFSLIALATILLIIGAAFIPLSLKRVRNRIEGFDFLSLAFFICIIAFTISLVLYIFGIILVVRSMKRSSELAKEIEEVNSLRAGNNEINETIADSKDETVDAV